MNYELHFLPVALKEWKKLNSSIRSQFKKKLEERLKNPHVPSGKLSKLENHYKIKLKTSGYCLVYKVVDQKLFVLVVAIGKREKKLVYKKAWERQKKQYE